MRRVAVLAGLVAVRAAAARQSLSDLAATRFFVSIFNGDLAAPTGVAGRVNVLPVSERRLFAADAPLRVAAA